MAALYNSYMDLNGKMFKTTCLFIGLCLILSAKSMLAQSYTTQGGNVTWTPSGSSITEATLYISGTGVTHGDAFDGAMATTVSGTNITYSVALNYSATYSVAIQQVVVTNTGATASTYTLNCTGNLGSDGNTYYHYADDPSFNYTISSDNGIVNSNGGDPVVSLIYGWNLGYGTSDVSYTNLSDIHNYTISSAAISAGETHRYLFLVGVGSIDDQTNNYPSNAQTAVANLQTVSNWPADFTSFLTITQMAQVKNWNLLAGDNCSNAINLASLSSPFNGTTVGYTDDISTCRTGYPDRIFYIDVPNNYQIDIWQSENNYDSYQYLGYGATCPGTQLYCYDDPDTQNNSWTNTQGSTQKVWYIQDSYSGSGTFTLNWSLTNPCTVPSISTHPSTSTQSLCLNASASALSVVAGGTSPNYQWYSNTSASNSGGSSISGATSSSYTPPTSVAGTKYYYCYVSNGCGYVTSNVSGAITVNALPAISSQSTAAQTICINGTATAMTITAIGAGITYQWYSNTSASNSGGTSLGTATGAQTASYTPLTTTAGVKYYYCIVSGTCTPTATSSVSGAITINALPAITGQPSTGAQTICLNGTATALTVTATGAGLTYQWYRNTSSSNSGGTTLGTATGAQTSSYTPLTTAVGVKYYYCIVSGTCTPTVTTTVSGAITINAVPVSGTLTPNVAAGAVCAGTSVSATAAAGSGGAGTIADVLQYRFDGGTWTTYTSGTSLTTTGHTSVAIQTYRTASASGCTTSTPVVVTWTVNALPAISSQSTAAQTICLNGTATALTVTATGAGITYQWYSNTSASNSGGTTLGTATGAQTASYTPLTTSAGIKYYYCIVSGTCTPTVTSTVSGAITINAIPVSGTLTPSVAAGAVCVGTSVSATATAGSGGAGTIADVLQSRYDGGSWTAYTSGTSLTTMGHTSVSIQTYRTASASGCTTSSANVVNWTVNALPAITGQPSTGAQTICLNGTATALTVTASGAGITYQWYSNTSASNSGGTSLGTATGAQTSSYTPLTTTAGVKYYYCIVSGTCSPTVTSTVSGAITINAITAISSQSTPAQTICLNGTATAMTVTAAGAALTYQWYSNTTASNTGGTSLGTATGAQTNSYTPLTTAAGVKYYYCIVGGTCTSSVTSSVSGAITINALPAISSQSTAAQTVCLNGTAAAMTVTAAGAGITYQWYSNTTASNSGGTSLGTATGAQTASYTPLTTSVGVTYYYCIVSGTCTPTATSAVSGAITINAIPVSGTLTPTPAAGAVCVGTSVSATATAGSGGSGTVADVLQYKYDAGAWTTYTSGTSLTTTGHTSVSIQTYRTASASGCTSSTPVVVSWTVNALPTVAAITGTPAVCTQFTTTLSCATASGVWSSGSTGVATVNSSGVVTGVTAGTAVISYTVTNGSTGCANASTASVVVSASLAAPTSVTATPPSIQSGQSSNLNATSAGKTIYWYTAATGGSAAGSSASGANFSVSPTVTTTYYAEANSTQSFYINTLTANNSYVTDHNSYTGDDRGGIAVTASYYYYTGDNYTVRYSMPGLTNPVSCTRRDGLFSDLGTGTLYTLHNGSSDPIHGSNVSPFNVTSFRTMSADLAIGASAAVTLSSAVSMSSGSAAIYAGSNFVILQNGTTFYRVDIPSGTVTNMGSYSISRYGSESWATWGVAELNNGVYSVLYREASSQSIKRLNLSTGAVTTLATFTNLSDLCSFTYSPTYSRWYFHYEGGAQFGGSSETAAYADGTHTVSSAGCPSASRTAVTVTVANPPTVTTASITDINATTATGGGNVTDQGGAAVTVSGVCWSTSQNPTTALTTKTTDGATTGAFTTGITGLTAGTLYYVRAYATNTIGTSYGSQVSFTSYSPGTIGSDQSVCSGANPALFTSVAAAVGMPGVTYQWQSSTNNSVFNNITGATSLTYQAGALSAQMYYRRNAISGSVTLSSNVITISINSGIAAPSPATATPPTILAGQSSNLNATSTDNNIKWYDDPTAGTLLTTVTSGTNYAVSPSATTTYYAQAVPISCSDNTLETILTNLNSNYTNITSQIPSPYNFALDAGVNSNYISDGGTDMYDAGNYVSTSNNSSFNYHDNSVLTSSIFGTGGKYFTRKVNNLFVLAADMNNVSWFKVNGNYGTDGGGSKSSSTFSITVECRTYNCFLSRVYGTSDPSINELFIIPANSSASHTGIANTADSYHQLNNITASTRMYYLLYAGTSGGLISDASAQNIATAFITQTQAVLSGLGGCPSASRTPVTVTVSSVPTVTTDAISAIAATTATGGGNVTADGGSTVTARGVCWSTAQNPIATGSHTTDGSGTGTFTSSITGLTAGTTYYVRAYATNSMGTGYGAQLSFTPFQLGSFPNINKTYGDPPFTLVNPTSGSPGAFSYSSGNTDVAAILGNTVTIQQAGTSTITATQAASGGYGSATTNCLLTVSKANQVLTLNIPTTQPLNTFTGGSTLTISATSSSGLPVTITINAVSSTATATLTPTANPGEYILSDVSNAGIIVFDASQAGNVNYNAATISQSLTVTMGNQVITFNALPSKTYGDPAFTVTATGGASGNPVIFTSSNTAIATCSGTYGATVTIIGAGSCLITANQAGNASWNAAAAVSQTLTVGKATPVIINFDDISKSFDAVPFTLNATSASTGAFTYSSSNSDVATVSGNTVTVQGVGTSTLTANQAADDNYFAASETATLTVGQASQTITITAIPDIYLIDFEPTPITVTASSSSGLPVTLTLQSGSVATIDGTTLTSTGATGSVTVIANQAGNASFAAATQVTEVFAVTKANQTITFDALPTKHVGDPDFDLTATTTSELLITYTSSNTNVATIDDKTVHIAGAGTTNITASQDGNVYYNAATPVIRAQVVDAEQFINWTGAVSTDWNIAGNWNPSGVPVITDNLIIGSTANQPHVTLSASSPALSNKLNIESGATLTIDAGKALTINGIFTNNGTMLIESSAEGTGSLITNSSIANNGTISIQRYITKDKWHMVSSPVADATANTYLGDYLQQWTESEAKWIDIEEPSTVLNVTEGYGLWTTQSTAHTYTYTGTPNTGNKTKTLTFNEVPFMDNDGANLLGNPYPSSIDWSELDDMYGAVHYWVGNGIDGDGSYVTWLNSLGEGSRYIPPMQGFFIVTQAAGTFAVANSNRAHSDAAFYKSTDEIKDNLLVLETVSKNISDKLYLQFDPSTDQDFELRNDAYKFMSGTPGLSELYSYTGAGSRKLSIDVRPRCEMVQLGFTNTLSGDYQIRINEVFGQSEVTLEDTKTNTFTDLQKGSYSFSYATGENDKRFKLHFAPLGTDDVTKTMASIYSYNKTAYINLYDLKHSDIYIYTMAGQLVASRESASGMVSVNLNTGGVYIVKVVSDNEIMTKRIFINQ